MKESIHFKLFSDIGMGEIFISRLIHFDEILNGIFGGKEKEAIHEGIMKVIFEGLEPAFRSLRDLKKKWDDLQVPENEKIQLVKSIYSNLVIAFKDRFQEVIINMGYDIGFIFKKEKEFQKECAKFFEKHPKINPKFIEVLKEDKKWIQLMVDVRNDVIDHKAGKNPERVKHLSNFLNLECVETLSDNCWRTMEDIMVALAEDKTEPIYGMKILEITAYHTNKDHPERFSWFDISEKEQAS